LAGLETDFLNVTGGPGANLDGLHRLGAAGEFSPLDDLFLLHRRDCDSRWRMGLGLGGGVATAGHKAGGRSRKDRYQERSEYFARHGLVWFGLVIGAWWTEGQAVNA
jgi:hypothetical protein